MLSRIIILQAFLSVSLGASYTDTSQEIRREGRAWDWQKFFDKATEAPVVVYEGGDVTIGEEGGDFLNPTLGNTRQRVIGNITTRQEEPAEYQDIKVIYTATLRPPADTVQLKISIIYLNILGPDEGDCINDTLVINGANSGLEIPILCGIIADQTSPAEWFIYVSYLKEADTVEHRCLQYHSETTGIIESFNYQADPPGMMLNDQTYSICFGYVVGYCDIAFTFARLDLGLINGDCSNSNNYLLIGDDKFCGDKIDYLITANATGPINVGVRSGAFNEMEEEGFFATYMMIGC